MKRSKKKTVEIDIRLEYLVGIRLIKYLFLVKYEVPEKYRIGKPVLQTIRASRKLKDLVDSGKLENIESVHWPDTQKKMSSYGL